MKWAKVGLRNHRKLFYLFVYWLKGETMHTFYTDVLDNKELCTFINMQYCFLFAFLGSVILLSLRQVNVNFGINSLNMVKGCHFKFSQNTNNWTSRGQEWQVRLRSNPCHFVVFNHATVYSFRKFWSWVDFAFLIGKSVVISETGNGWDILVAKWPQIVPQNAYLLFMVIKGTSFCNMFF